MSFCIVLFAQTKSDWLDENYRNTKYPQNAFLTGFIYRIVENGISETTQQAKIDAQADLVKQVRLMLKSKTQSQSSALSINGKYDERESFDNQTSAEANAEIVGMKTETCFDPKSNLVYAFAYVNKSELIGYYKSNLSLNVNQIESFLKTAQDLEIAGEKAKARVQCESAKPLLEKVRSAQDLLTAIDVDISSDDLQQAKTESLHNLLAQMLARLAQGVYVYVEDNEDLFSVKVNIIANQLKADLAKNGCSFVETPEQADFKLKINVSTRPSSYQGGIMFCYADAQVELYDIRKQKVVYSDEIEQKGGGVSQDKAGRKAMSDVVPCIFEKLKPWIEN